MMKTFVKVKDVMKLLGCSKSVAYKLMHEVNAELEAEGHFTVDGRVSSKRLLEKLGLKDEQVKEFEEDNRAVIEFDRTASNL